MQFVLVLLMLLLPWSMAQAAGFDCRKARTADEVAVCADLLLGELDEIMTVFASACGIPRRTSITLWACRGNWWWRRVPC